jgi:phage tail-like protein
MDSGLNAVSGYVAHLPAILQQGSFMGRFLLAFEAVLSGGVKKPEGFSGALPLGLEEMLDDISSYFTPDEAPELFFPWLSQWVARSISDDWSLNAKRNMLSQAVSLYKTRGTRQGIQDVLNICLERSATANSSAVTNGATVTEVHDDDRPHYFEVTLVVTERKPAELAKKARQVRAIVDQEKPAHTYYSLTIQYPGLRVNNDPKGNPDDGPGVIVGETTVLGTMTASATELKTGTMTETEDTDDEEDETSGEIEETAT